MLPKTQPSIPPSAAAYVNNIETPAVERTNQPFAVQLAL